MIVHPRPDVLRVLFTLKGSIVKRIALRCLMVTLLAALIVLVERHFPAFFYPVSATPFTLLGLSLSIFMSFRNNACYDRWWEGRKAWGKLIIETRSFVRESGVIADEKLRAELLRSLCGFAHGLNARLRNESEVDATRPWLDGTAPVAAHNVCDGILRAIGTRCSQLAEHGQISEWRYTLLEQRLAGLTEVQATCERIKGSPLPFPYTLLLHRTIYIFCLLLPFALAEPLGWHRCSPPSSVIPSSAWMRSATSWRTRSGGMRTTCRWMRWCARWSGMCWGPWEWSRCHRCCCRWTLY